MASQQREINGTVFQRSVWETLRRIPKGRITTYGAIAKHLGCGGARAVGTAVGANPDAPHTPCHRVVRADGRMGGYSAPGGIETKIGLLTSEGVRVENDRIVDMDTLFFDGF